MARKPANERLAQLDEQRRALKARIAKQTKANETRRAVLIGELAIKEIEAKSEAGNQIGTWLKSVVPNGLPREEDKPLFDFVMK